IGESGLDFAFWATIIASLLAVLVGSIVGYLVHSDKNEQKVQATAPKSEQKMDDSKNNASGTSADEVISEPKDDFIVPRVSGEMKNLKLVDYPVFSSLAMGKGIAIKPSSDTIIAPLEAKVESLFPTGHAIGLKSKNGTELLIHIGIDTVKLDGLGFKPLVNQGDIVQVDQPLIQFDSETIRNHSYDDIVMVVITNTNETKDVVIQAQNTIKEKDSLISVIY